MILWYVLRLFLLQEYVVTLLLLCWCLTFLATLCATGVSSDLSNFNAFNAATKATKRIIF
jgi:hypothetical protein